MTTAPTMYVNFDIPATSSWSGLARICRAAPTGYLAMGRSPGAHARVAAFLRAQKPTAMGSLAVLVVRADKRHRSAMASVGSRPVALDPDIIEKFEARAKCLG